MKSLKHFLIYLTIFLFSIEISGQPGTGGGPGGGAGGPGGGQGNDPCNRPNPPAACVPVDQGIVWLMLAGGLFGFGIIVYQTRENRKASSS